MSWLDANAEGLAFALWVFGIVALALVLAWLIEFFLAHGMRRRADQREAHRRYCDSIIDRCYWKTHKTEGQS